MVKTHHPDGFPIIWPWLTEQDTEEWPDRTLSTWLYSVCGSDLAFNSAAGLFIRRHRKNFHFSLTRPGEHDAWKDVGSSFVEVWNSVGEELGYTEWASPEEGDGRP